MFRFSTNYRTHSCGELRSSQVDRTVKLAGWIMRRRDHGGVLFIDLRDNFGITQVVFGPDLANQVQHIKLESVISILGKVVPREEGLLNSRLDTGAIEVKVESYSLLSECETLPFPIADEEKAPEATRLKHRYLELRRETLHRKIKLRASVIHAMRDIMYSLGFTEFQTPILTSSSPEGARDFIVPSRLHPGKFFALPQAPQQFKQLLMVGGFDRYFQIAPCFRDEDARADRTPGEFYQLDLEMSFVEQEDVFAVAEELFARLFSRFSPKPISVPFPRIPYEESLSRFGTDKPDLRIPIEIKDVSDIFKQSSFRVFQRILEDSGRIFALGIPLTSIPSRSYLDETVTSFSKASSQGLIYLTYEGNEFKSSIAKHITAQEASDLRAILGMQNGAVFVAGGGREILPHLGRLRLKLGSDFCTVDNMDFQFCWITDFPMFERNDKGTIDFSHNPFSMPQGGMEALKTKSPLEVKAFQYDIVCNGYELSSGAIRNHSPETMYEAFRIAGYTKEEVDTKFGGLLNAFTFGAPPHGGMAPGIDRIVMLLAGEEHIRDVIAFPMSQTGEDLMMGAPSVVSEKHMKEVHIRVELPK